MKELILFCALSFGFSACGDHPTVAGTTPPSSAKPAASTQPAKASVTWRTVDLTGGEKDLYVAVNGRDYYLKRVKWFNRTSRGEYSQMGIPQSAVSAGSFSESSEEEESQGIYAADIGSGVSVFTGYYVPGAMHDVNWSVLKVISH
tara:strand:+ start:443 stop:880 length:438 start_codon:yes stop_codon:yes gene_type:complete